MPHAAAVEAAPGRGGGAPGEIPPAFV